MRNMLTAVPKTAGPMVASIIRTIFAQPDTEHVFAQFHEVVRMLSRSHPKVADMLEGWGRGYRNLSCDRACG